MSTMNREKWTCQLLSCVWFLASPRTVACPAPPSMGFSRQECWSGWPFPLQGIIPTQESNPGLLYFGQILVALLRHQGRPGLPRQDAWTRCPLDGWIPSCYEVTPLGPGNVLCSEVNNVNIASWSFLLFRVAWYIFFYHFIFNLFALFYLKQTSCSKCKLGLAFYVIGNLDSNQRV